jgi:hypothetical protein
MVHLAEARAFTSALSSAIDNALVVQGDSLTGIRYATPRPDDPVAVRAVLSAVISTLRTDPDASPGPVLVDEANVASNV